MLYTPLAFVEQMEHYFKIANAPSQEMLVNQIAIQRAESIIKSDRNQVYSDFGVMRLGNRKAMKPIKERLTPAYEGFMRGVGIPYGFELEDFIAMLVYYDVRRIWRKNKLSYLVDATLFDKLSNMKLPKLAPTDCLAKLPAECFYVDYNGVGSKICEDIEGTFITTANDGEYLRLTLVHLLNSEKLKRKLIFTTAYSLELSESERFIPNSSYENSISEIECEDGVIRHVDEVKLVTFLYNFLIYLHASNKDVQISERTRKNHDKPVKTIKNKFKEVKEFEVGFTYGKAIKANQVRVKYVDDKENTSEHKKRTVSSHYRSAHWHHYWTGSGADKKLIIKWVDGVFVNGDEAKNVQVHKVE